MAAPVTSLEQVEAVHVKPRSSQPHGGPEPAHSGNVAGDKAPESKSPEAADGEEVAEVSAEEASEPTKQSASESHEPIESGVHASNSLNEAIADTQAAKESNETVKNESSENESTKKESTKKESTKKESTEAPEHEFAEKPDKFVTEKDELDDVQEKPSVSTSQESSRYQSVEVDPLKEVPPEREADPVQIPEAKSDAEQAGRPRSEPEWLVRAQEENSSPKELKNSPNDNPSPGVLRKHSIAAMKELGSPESTMDSAGTEPPEEASFDYSKFMECLRMKSADPIARYIKSFLQEFSRGSWTPAQQEKIVADFMKFISFKMRDFEPFASMPKQERRVALEGVEKLIMTRLYTRTFPPKMPPLLRTDGHNEDLLRDQVFEERMRLWGWVEGRHLDINHDYISHEAKQANFVDLATKELGRLGQFKSPRDKMICILNCSKIIYALIRQAKLEQNADSFLPLLIYVVLKSHPAHLVSTINYIQRFRNREFQRGETAYYLSTLASAVAFLESLDKTSLTISDEEFEQRMADSVQAETNRIIQQQNHAALEEENPAAAAAPPAGESSAAVITSSASMLVDRMRRMTTKLWEDFEDDRAGLPAVPGHSQPSQAPADEAQVTQAANPAASHAASQASAPARAHARAGVRAATQASIDEYESARAQQQQFEDASQSLQSMFPLLDKDLIEDVLHQSGTNLGAAVDMCLALAN